MGPAVGPIDTSDPPATSSAALLLGLAELSSGGYPLSYPHCTYNGGFAAAGPLALSQRRYLSLAYAVEEHRANGKELQRRLAEVAKDATDLITDVEAAKMVRGDLVGQQTGIVELILEHCENDERDYLDLARKLHDKLREIFGYTFYWRKVTIIKIAP